MTAHVALLRGVNVGGAHRMTMADLAALAAGMGLTKPRTLLQSGNLVFDSPGAAADLETRLQAGLAQRFGFDIDVMVRAADDWRGLIRDVPFVAEARDDPAHLLAVVLKQPPEAGALDRLRAVVTGPETAVIVGRTAYIHYPAGIGGSRLTQAVIDRALGARGTARNWNTVRKIGDMLSAP